MKKKSKKVDECPEFITERAVPESEVEIFFELRDHEDDGNVIFIELSF